MNLAYVAGLVDGEGSIGFTKVGAHRSWVPRVSITNTNLDVLEDIGKKFGGYIVPLSQRKEGWKQGYSWLILNSSAVSFIDLIYPWLRIKREQAWLLFLWDCIRPGKGIKRTTETIEALELINAQSKWLNMKGCNRPSKSPIDLEIDAYREQVSNPAGELQ
jgi:hypothetical protein